jgi:hypothetical protein
MLLSKALKMQQDTEDRKNKVIIKGLEDKIKELETSLKGKKHPAANSRRLPCRITIPKY